MRPLRAWDISVSGIKCLKRRFSRDPSLVSSKSPFYFPQLFYCCINCCGRKRLLLLLLLLLRLSLRRLHFFLAFILGRRVERRIHRIFPFPAGNNDLVSPKNFPRSTAINTMLTTVLSVLSVTICIDIICNSIRQQCALKNLSNEPKWPIR